MLNRLSPTQWSLRWRLFLAFTLVLTLTLVFTAVIWWELRGGVREDEALASSPATVLSDNTTSSILNAATSLRGYLLSGDPTERANYEAAVASYTAFLDQVSQDPNRPDTAPLWRAVAAELAAQRADFDAPAIALREAVDAGEADPAALDTFIQIATAEAQQAQITDLLFRIEALDDAHVARLQAEAAAEWSRLQLLLGLGLTFIIISGVALTMVVVRNVSRPVERLANAATAIAAGKLDQRVGWHGNDELGQMARAFDTMADQLQAQMLHLESGLATSKRQEATLSTIIENVGVGILLVDNDNNLVVANPQATTFLGMPPGIIRPGVALCPLINAFPPPVQEAVLEIHGRNDGETTLVHSGTVVLTGPTSRVIEMTMAPVRNADEPQLAHIWLIRDVTRDHTVNEMKTDFVSMVAHEFRTPLTSIKGYVDLLLDGEVGEVSADQRDFLQIVAGSTDRLVTLINDVLDISRIESGQIVLTTTAIDLRAILRAVGEAMRPLMDAKKQGFTLHLPDTALMVDGDAGRLAQVFTNLLSNASKYSPVGSPITVLATAEAATIAVDVIDRGIGLTPEEQTQLFTRFFRASNRAVQTAGGTGLGLTITRSLVELHGGSIRVETAPGEGSTFSVRLPRLAATAITPASPPRQHGAPGPERAESAASGATAGGKGSREPEPGAAAAWEPPAPAGNVLQAR